MNPRIRGLARVALLAAAAALPACKDSTGPKAGPAARLDIVAGNTQSAPAGTELPQAVVVKVTDAKGRAVKGQVVNFVVTAGGGHVFAGTALTNDDGVAQERWTLGTVAGAPQTLEARAVDTNTGQALVFATFTATATPGAPATLVALNGDTTVVGVSGAAVEDSFAVVARDQYGNAVPGAQVTWAVLTGGGTVATPSTTDAQGIARTQWVLGTAGGAQRASATAGGQTVRFTALTPTALVRVGADSVIAPAGSTITATVAADAPGGLPVHWTVGSGGGSVSAAVTRTVDVAGGGSRASVQWTLGAAGPQTLTASSGSLSVTFHATAVPAAQRRLLGTVPGRVLDADLTRLLWLDSASVTSRQVKIRTLSTGTDVVVASPQGLTGRLTPTGALAVSSGELFEYRAGNVADLGPIALDQGAPVLAVEGNWAAWITGSGGSVIRRDLQAGTNLNLATLPAFNRASVDVAPGGEVVYEAWGQRTGSFVYLYRNGTTTTVGSGAVTPAQPQTDGTNVVWVQYTLTRTYDQWLWHDGTTELLANISSPVYPYPHPMVAAGYVAFNRLSVSQTDGTVTSQVWVRAPGGGETAASHTGFVALIEALAPDGSVMFGEGSWAFNNTTYTRRYIAFHGGPLVDAGPYEGTAIERGGHFFLLLGGSAYELTQ